MEMSCQMHANELSEDLAFARRLAEEGARAPSLSGRFSVWWGALVTVALLVHWSIATGQLAVHPAVIGFIWLGVAVLGNAGTVVLARSLADKPGQGSALNRTEYGTWPVIGSGIVLYAAIITVIVIGRGQPPVLFDTIMPVAFLLYAAGDAASAALQRRSPFRSVSGLSLVLAGLTAALIGLPAMYLVAALGVVATQVIPGLIALRAEPGPLRDE